MYAVSKKWCPPAESSRSLVCRASKSLRRQRVHVLRASAGKNGAHEHQPAVVIGGGIGGLAAAVAFHKVGIPVMVLESADGPRGEGAAIGVWTNGWRALEALGVANQLRDQHPLLSRIELCSNQGPTLRAFPISECSGGPHEFRGVRRGTLLCALASQLPTSAIQYGAEVVGIQHDSSSGGVQVQLQSGVSVKARLVVGADGARSLVARQLGLAAPGYQGYVACRGVATLPGGLPVPVDTCRQVFGQGVRAGMYPISPTECYWFTCFNAEEGAPVPSTAAARKQEALNFVEGWEVGIRECIHATPVEGISRSRIADRWTTGAYGSGLVTLVGDAAHPMTPNLGQGGCVALEDAVKLANAVAGVGAQGGASSEALVAALRAFEAERSTRALPITVRANLMGAALQLPYEPVCAVRNWVVANVYSPAHFLDHATYDCGNLSAAEPVAATR